jgi:hypothetical protein
MQSLSSHQTNLDLRIVPITSVIPHELEDSQRAEPLIRRLPQEKILKNPPVVAKLITNPNYYVILDGTNRVIALSALHYTHILVQVVPYQAPDVELHTWNHVITNVDVATIHARLLQIPELQTKATTELHARAELARRTILGYLLLPNQEMLCLIGGGLDLIRRTELLQNIVDTYLGIGQLHRTNLDTLDVIQEIYPQASFAVIFPKYEPVEILDLAEAGLRVPTGITRHVIHGRALRVNYPLTKLQADQTLTEKNNDLDIWIREQFSSKKVRFYAESIYLFDE